MGARPIRTEMHKLEPNHQMGIRSAGALEAVLDRWSALILAGGAARRYQAPKLLADLGGEPVIRRTVLKVLAAGFGDVVVATGSHHADLELALQGLACRIAHAPDWSEGMAATIRAGSAALRPGGSGLFLFLGDMPLVPTALCPPLAQLALDSGYAARPVVQGRPGHPVAFVGDAMADLTELTGDAGAAPLLHRAQRGVGYLPCDDMGAIFDIDRPGDLDTAQRLWNSRAISATSDSAISRGALPKP